MQTSDRNEHRDIRIGTLAPLADAGSYLKQILPHGFESFQLTTSGDGVQKVDLASTAEAVKNALGEKATISSLGIYGNTLTDESVVEGWKKLIKSAKLLGATTVCGFAGALEDRPVDASMSRFREAFEPIVKLAEDEGIKIGFENCEMGGTWEKPRFNIAHSPRAWEMMFNEITSDSMGLEWEPCHQMYSLIDPIPQIRKFGQKFVHVHGKDATIRWDVIKEFGIRSGEDTVWHRTPGFGDSDWTLIISLLRNVGYTGSIDIEGWHDPIYRDDLEMTGQVFALRHLQHCRGGIFVDNPRK